jgi:hypothetical protein
LQAELAKTRSEIKILEHRIHDLITRVYSVTPEEYIKLGQLKQDVAKIQYAIRAYTAYKVSNKEDV